MKKIMLSLFAVMCLVGFSSPSFADELGKMKEDMTGEKDKMKTGVKGKADEMKGKGDAMKKKEESMKGEMKGTSDEMKGMMGK